MIFREIIKLAMRGMQCAYLVFLFSCTLFCNLCDSEIESAYRCTFSDDIGYTLIGEKPIAIDELQDYYLIKHPKVCERFLSSLKEIFKNDDRFIFKIFKFGTGHEIELINRKALQTFISKSPYLQHFIANKFSSEEAIYSKLEDPNISIFNVIQNELIIGILFGYGEENSTFYCRLEELGYHLKKFPYVRCFEPDINTWTCLLEPEFPGMIDLPYVVKIPELGAGFDSLESEWEWMQTVRWDLWKKSEAMPPYFVNLPVYICKHGAESEALHAKYILARAKLAELFHGKSYKQAVAEEARKQ